VREPTTLRLGSILGVISDSVQRPGDKTMPESVVEFLRSS
jgi:hypothetical protein